MMVSENWRGGGGGGGIIYYTYDTDWYTNFLLTVKNKFNFHWLEFLEIEIKTNHG